MADPPISAPTYVSPELDVSIVMPCLNEAVTLRQCIDMARAALTSMEERWSVTGEVVVADNGSTDGSQDLAENLGARVVECPVRGYGAALRYGIYAARGRLIVMGDADASYDFREAVPMVERLLEGDEVCMGSRLKGAILPNAMPWKNRYIGNPVLTGILNLFFRSGFSDAHCGLRAFTKEAFVRIRPTSNGMEFASELVIKASLLGLRRSEVPVTLRPDGRPGPPHLRPFRDGWRHLRYLVMLSPVWLFLFPGVGLASIGAVIMAALLPMHPGTVFRLGSFWIGDHWMILASGFLSIGQLSLLLALTATLVGIRDGYRRPTRLLRGLYWLSRLEHMMMLSGIFLVFGVGVMIEVLLAWATTGFGPLAMQRYMVLATTFFVLAAQTFLGGFLLSIVAGNEADIAISVENARRRQPRSRRPGSSARGNSPGTTPGAGRPSA